MTPPLVDYLTSFTDTHITVASNLIDDAKRVANRKPSQMDAIYIDVFDVSMRTEESNFDFRLHLLKPW